EALYQVAQARGVARELMWELADSRLSSGALAAARLHGAGDRGKMLAAAQKQTEREAQERAQRRETAQVPWQRVLRLLTQAGGRLDRLDLDELSLEEIGELRAALERLRDLDLDLSMVEKRRLEESIARDMAEREAQRTCETSAEESYHQAPI